MQKQKYLIDIIIKIAFSVSLLCQRTLRWKGTLSTGYRGSRCLQPTDSGGGRGRGLWSIKFQTPSLISLWCPSRASTYCNAPAVPLFRMHVIPITQSDSTPRTHYTLYIECTWLRARLLPLPLCCICTFYSHYCNYVDKILALALWKCYVIWIGFPEECSAVWLCGINEKLYRRLSKHYPALLVRITVSNCTWTI